MAAPVLTAIGPSQGGGTAASHAAATASSGRPALSVVLILAATAVAEALLAFGYVRGIYGWPILLISHIAIVAALLLWVAAIGRTGRNTALPLLTAIAVSATGPIGAIAALVTLAFSRPMPGDRLLLEAWYERIALAVDTDEVTQLYDRIATGRTAGLSSVSARSFSAIVQSGSLADRQSALGVIARSFHPDYLPALMLALKSDEPVIRVQAAAVATKVRVDLRRLVDRCAAGHSALVGSAAISAAAQLRACIASGLLDEGDRIRAGILADRLGAAPPQNEIASLKVAPVADQLAAEALMLREGQFGALRVARRIARVASARLYRVRRFARQSRERNAARGAR